MVVVSCQRFVEPEIPPHVLLQECDQIDLFHVEEKACLCFKQKIGPMSVRVQEGLESVLERLMAFSAPVNLLACHSVELIVHALAIVSEVMAAIDIWHDLDAILCPVDVTGESLSQLVHHRVVNDGWGDPVASWPPFFWD